MLVIGGVVGAGDSACETVDDIGSVGMRITKYTHACVRLEQEGPSGVLVIDPGTWSEASALNGADAVLVTHEHDDHIDVLRLAALGVPVYAPAGADITGVQTIPVSPGEAFTAAGFPATPCTSRPNRSGHCWCPPRARG